MRFETIMLPCVMRIIYITSFNRVWSWKLLVPAIIMSIRIIKPNWLGRITGVHVAKSIIYVKYYINK